MRRAMWLAAWTVLGLAAVVMAKPPGLPAPAGGEGRVPVYPDGEKHREPTPKSVEPRKLNQRDAVPAQDEQLPKPPWRLLPLLLPPLDL